MKRDLDKTYLQEIRQKITFLRERMKYYVSIGEHEPSFLARFQGVGVLTREQVMKLGAVGPVARASGIKVDHRLTDSFSIYPELDMKICVEEQGDARAKYLVRMLELEVSCDLIIQMIDQMPAGEIAIKYPRQVPAGETVSRYEAPRGEDVHYLRANGTNKPARYKVRAPPLANVPAVLEMFKGAFVADIPVIIASIDPCVSCTDRAIVIRDRARGEQTMSWQELRDYGIRWYAQEMGRQ